MRPRRGTVALCALAATVALTWIGCSEESASPVAPTPAPAVSAPAAANSEVPASPGGLAGNDVRPPVTVQVDAGFSPSGTGNVGFDGGAGSPAATSLVIDTGALAPPATRVAPNPTSPLRPPAGPAGAAAAATLADAQAADAQAADAVKETPGESPAAQATHDSEAAGGEGNLKATAPMPTEPADGAEIEEVQPELEVTNAEPEVDFLADFAAENFEYEFEIRVDGGSGAVFDRSDAVPGGSGSTSWQVTKRLDRAASYEWRARASFDGAHGPWSEYASFTTAAVVLGPPAPRAPIGGGKDIDTEFNVGNPTVDGRIRGVARIRIEVATDDTFSSLVGSVTEDARPRGATNLALNVLLAPQTTYYWRARGIATARAGGDTVRSAWSEPRRFTTGRVTLRVPKPRAPIDGAVVGVGTHFLVRNGEVSGLSADRVQIAIRVATSRSFENPKTASTRRRDGVETTVDLGGDLMPNQRYFWQARARVSAGAAGEVASDWSDAANFRTSADGGGTVVPGPAGPFGPGGNPPNLLALLQEVARQNPDALWNSCQDHGGSWRFMELAVERLRQESGRWGYNCKRGNCPDVSHDAIAYFRGSGQTIADAQNSTNVAIIDIIAGHCGPNPQPSWLDVTQATADANSIGRWVYPRR